MSERWVIRPMSAAAAVPSLAAGNSGGTEVTLVQRPAPEFSAEAIRAYAAARYAA